MSLSVPCPHCRAEIEYCEMEYIGYSISKKSHIYNVACNNCMHAFTHTSDDPDYFQDLKQGLDPA